ncbi:MAG: DUF4388 domain-containing protein [Thermoanaerobaculia bacterium]|jgi:hypothetical protein
MAFQGSLKELPLPDIIQLVSVSGKTGKFTLSQESATGYIYLKNGQMIHATVLDLIGEEAIYALAIWNQGDFQFTPNEEAPQQTITKSNTNLLMEAARRLDEWRVLSKKIPSVDLVPTLVPRQNRHEQITLNPQEWLVITQIDTRRSIADIGKALRMSGFDVAKLLYGLITSELVDLKKKPEPAGASAPAGDGGGGHLIALADQIRVIADKYIGESGSKTVDKHYHLAVDAIRSGKGELGLRQMVAEFEKATSLLRGLAMSEQFRQEVSRLSR